MFEYALLLLHGQVGRIFLVFLFYTFMFCSIKKLPVLHSITILAH